MENYKTAHITINETQLQTLKNLYIEMLDIESIDTSLFNFTSVLIDLDYNIDFIFNRSFCNYEQVHKLFKDILYTKSYWIYDTSISCCMLNGGTFEAKNRSLTSFLLELFDFETSIYALWYAHEHVKVIDPNNSENEQFLYYVIYYIFNLDNIQETYLTISEEV